MSGHFRARACRLPKPPHKVSANGLGVMFGDLGFGDEEEIYHRSLS